ncbi:hypothetical protein [Oceanobacillus timonensis]|uniref:hypothetical protein n=1 Tax=Oceanobacillus timonensis TaxID=1926285 RepID=UPI0009BBF36D|nr:hypothetical protein [Oceanobacillus timonensis]
MDWNNDQLVEYERRKAKHKIIIGSIYFLMILLIIAAIVWVPVKIIYAFGHPEETQLMLSQSPNQENEIEVVKIAEFPDPILQINYDNQTIKKTKMPHDISVEWKNDREASVILARSGREPDIVHVEFEE